MLLRIVACELTRYVFVGAYMNQGALAISQVEFLSRIGSVSDQVMLLMNCCLLLASQTTLGNPCFRVVLGKRHLNYATWIYQIFD